jgi:hypothetical protein
MEFQQTTVSQGMAERMSLPSVVVRQPFRNTASSLRVRVRVRVRVMVRVRVRRCEATVQKHRLQSKG